MTTPGNIPPEDQGARPAAPVTIGEAEVAANYVERELHRAKQSRNVTAIVGLILMAAALTETLVVGGKTAENLKPATAAQTASGLIADRLEDNQTDLQNAIAQRLPEFIHQIPDQVEKQIPGLREKLETTALNDLNQYATSTSSSMKTQLTDYLTAHKDEVHTALTSGADPSGVHALAQGLSQTFMTSLQSQSEGGETLQDKIDMTQQSLSDIKANLDRLAANKGLNADDKRTRHIIAIMARSINSQTPKANLHDAITNAQGTVASNL